MGLLPFARREVGLLHCRLKSPRKLSLESLGDPRLKFINREAGSGLRIWLDQQITRLGIPPGAIHGYDQAAGNHELLAECIRAGEAEVGLGLAAVAGAFGLEFTPLYEEQYDLIFPWELLSDARFTPLREWLHGKEHRALLKEMGGYRLPDSPETIPLGRVEN